MNSHFYMEQIIVVVCYLVEMFNIETVNKRISQICLFVKKSTPIYWHSRCLKNITADLVVLMFDYFHIMFLFLEMCWKLKLYSFSYNGLKLKNFIGPIV